MTIERVKSYRGADVLAELKELIDSFPDHRRKDVIQVVKNVFTSLNTEYPQLPVAERASGREPIGNALQPK